MKEETKPTDKHVKMAKGVAFDPRYRAGNLTGAVRTIEKIKKGLSAHPAVKKALQRANEEVSVHSVRKMSNSALQKHWEKHKDQPNPSPALGQQLRHVASELKRRKALKNEEALPLLPKQKEVQKKVDDASRKQLARRPQAGTLAVRKAMEKEMTKMGEAANPVLAPHKHMAKKASPFHAHTNQLVYSPSGKQTVRPIDNSDAGYGGETVADAEGGEADAGKASKKAAKPMKMPTLVKPLSAKQPTNEQEESDMEEKKTMAQTQLHFLKYAAEEMLEYIDMGGEVEEWYQNKLSKVHSEVESLHSYMEGEKRRLGMEEDEEENEMDEAYTVGNRSHNVAVSDLLKNKLANADAMHKKNKVGKEKYADMNSKAVPAPVHEVAGQRGRPKKGEGEESDRHIIMQLRSASDLPGPGGMSTKEVKFRGGKKGKVSIEHAKKILKFHDHPSTKPVHKRMLRVAISKSPEHLERVAKQIP